MYGTALNSCTGPWDNLEQLSWSVGQLWTAVLIYGTALDSCPCVWDSFGPLSPCMGQPQTAVL